MLPDSALERARLRRQLLALVLAKTEAEEAVNDARLGAEWREEEEALEKPCAPEEEALR